MITTDDLILDAMCDELHKPTEVPRESITIWQDLFCVFVMLADEHRHTPRLTKMRIAKVTGLTHSEIVYALKQMKDKGWIEVVDFNKERIWGGTIYAFPETSLVQACHATGLEYKSAHESKVEQYMARVAKHPWTESHKARLVRPLIARAVDFLLARAAIVARSEKEIVLKAQNAMATP